MGRRISGLVMVLLMLAGVLRARATTTPARHRHKTVSASTSHRLAAHSVRRTRAGAAYAHAEVAHVARRSRAYGHATMVRVSGTRRRIRYYGERFTASSFTDENLLTANDVTAGEDPVVRAAAVEALGNMNGTVLAIDPSDGRILAMVNQKLALSAGAEPCSTIKVAVALAALKEGLVKADTPVNLGGHYSVDLTHALARSINLYFEVLGRSMGFERVKHYANEFGLGELAGYNIPGEHLGVYPDTVLPAADGGVGRMCSFGESISMTPLQLGALVSAIANGGTLYYLQHPTTQAEVANFQPQVKRHPRYQGCDSADSSGYGGRGGLFGWHGALAANELCVSFRCSGRPVRARITGRGLAGL